LVPIDYSEKTTLRNEAQPNLQMCILLNPHP
jgi:hypothetical protein